tara:strand:+ start:75 stop:395 length:321 start_codon:yes stop_codon:yes gene_type:complete
MTDIFRKRPILGNRILVPIRDKPKPKPLRWKNIMQHWEAERRCRYYKERKESWFNPPTGCKSLERNASGTKFWRWGCNCDLDMTMDDAVKIMKGIAFNWNVARKKV